MVGSGAAAFGPLPGPGAVRRHWRGETAPRREIPAPQAPSRCACAQVSLTALRNQTSLRLYAACGLRASEGILNRIDRGLQCRLAEEGTSGIACTLPRTAASICTSEQGRAPLLTPCFSCTTSFPPPPPSTTMS